jgi:ABC-type lipoprotein release transport system permease subunit
MYLKLMVRGLRRHRAAGLRLFVLLGVCSAAVLLCLSFRDSFVSRFRQLGIDTATAHLQILPADSPKVQDMAFADQREGLSLLTFSPELEQFLARLPGVEHVMLAIETRAAIFTTEGEQTIFAPSLMGVDPRDLTLTLPGVTVLEGAPDLAWRPGMPDVPVFRPPLEFWEIIKDNDRFTRKNFRFHGDAWESFKARVEADMPSLFQPAPRGKDDEAFLAAMNHALDRADLPALLPAWTGERYDYRIDDAQAALLAAESARAAASGSPSREASSTVRVLRKRLLQAVYPDAITPVRDTINLDVSYTMAVPAARGDDPLAKPAVLPVAITAYVQRLPMFYYTYYIDARPLREQLGLGSREGTSIYIRMGSLAAVPAAKQEIARWLSAHQQGCVVRDYTDIGKLFLGVASGFQILTLVLIAIFMASVTIFIVNTVLLSLIKRRREIGTAIAIGLAPEANVLILFGEMLVLVLVSWAIGTAVGVGLVLLLHVCGLPGIIFMPEGRLFLDLSARHVAVSLGVFLCASTAASLLPLVRLARVAPLELLKEISG